MGISGIGVLIDGLHNAMNSRVIKVEEIAGEYAKKALLRFRQHQFSSLHEPDGKAQPETAEKKADAIAFVKANAIGPPVTSFNKAWINRSFRAARSVYADYGNDGKMIYFSLYHTMSYGVYLELAKNRKYAAIEPVVRGLASDFIQDIKAVFE